MADELEAIRQLKARYCRFLDAKDAEAWRSVFTADVVVTLDMAVSTGGADPMTAPPVEGVDNFVPMVLGSLENAATMHHCHTPEITLTSADHRHRHLGDGGLDHLRRRPRVARRRPLPRDLRESRTALGGSRRCT